MHTIGLSFDWKYCADFHFNQYTQNEYDMSFNWSSKICLWTILCLCRHR